MKIVIRRIFFFTFSTALFVVLTSCSFTKGKANGEQAVVKFHNQFNAGQYHEIYAQSDDGFRKATSEADALALFEAVRRKLGTVKNSTQTRWHVNATPAGTMVSLAYDVEFSEGKGSEEFVFHLDGDKALLFNYHVNSPLLITK